MTLQFVHLNFFVVFSFGEFIWLLLILSQKLFIIKLISSHVLVVVVLLLLQLNRMMATRMLKSS